MKKIFFAVLAAIAITSQVSAQDSKNTFGVRVGANMANVSMKFFDFKVDTDPMIGFHIGASYQRDLGHNFFAETGLYGSMKGYKMSGSPFEDSLLGEFVETEETETTKTSILYLQLPVMVGYEFNLNDNIALQPAVGGYFGYAISGKSKYGSEKYDLFKEIDGEKAESKRGDFGLRFGVGAKFSERYYAGLGYELGLSNTSNYSDEGISAKNGCFTLSLGYNF